MQKRTCQLPPKINQEHSPLVFPYIKKQKQPLVLQDSNNFWMMFLNKLWKDGDQVIVISW